MREAGPASSRPKVAGRSSHHTHTHRHSHLTPAAAVQGVREGVFPPTRIKRRGLQARGGVWVAFGVAFASLHSAPPLGAWLGLGPGRWGPGLVLHVRVWAENGERGGWLCWDTCETSMVGWMVDGMGGVCLVGFFLRGLCHYTNGVEVRDWSAPRRHGRPRHRLCRLLLPQEHLLSATPPGYLLM